MILIRTLSHTRLVFPTSSPKKYMMLDMSKLHRTSHNEKLQRMIFLPPNVMFVMYRSSTLLYMGHPQSSKFSWISVVLFCSRSLLSDALHHIGKRISRKIVEDFSTRSANLFDPWVPFYQFHSPLEIVRLESIINYNLWLHLLTLPLCPPCHFIEV